MPLRPLPDVAITGAFWNTYKELVAEKVLPYQWSALNDQVAGIPPSHAVENLRIAAGEVEGEFAGMVFQDSDVAKWIEATAYSLRERPDPVLEERADELIALLGRVQQPDGYLNSFYIVTEPVENRWNNLRDCHELYCAGHLIEAGVAYAAATGKRRLLDIVVKYADLIDRTFGRGPGQRRGYPGHPEIELALVRLADATGEQRYLDLAHYFLTERGTAPHYFDLEEEARASLAQTPRSFPVINPADVDREHLNYGLGYAFQQAHEPFLEQSSAVGHAVRATYLYAAAADVALRTGDERLRAAVDRLWRDVVDGKLYLTAGIGSQVPGESFTDPYDLPNEGMYCETCASVGLVFWAARMGRVAPRGEYGDIVERAIYNGTISGLGLDGESYFYINPQQYTASMAGRQLGWDISRPDNRRQNWFACSCCPMNLARMISSIDQYVYQADDRRLVVDQYIGSTTSLRIGGVDVEVAQESGLPWAGDVRLRLSPSSPAEFAMWLRVPQWADELTLSVNGVAVEGGDPVDGYRIVTRTWSEGDVVELRLGMPVRTVRASTRVSENRGKVALQRGPVVYCLEECDNGSDLAAIALDTTRPVAAEFRPDLLGGVVALRAEGWRETEPQDAPLYGFDPPRSEPAEVTAIPYYSWANRAAGEMRVWIRDEGAGR